MKLVLDSLMIFFGTLVAAGLVALGEPVETGSVLPQAFAAPATLLSPR